MAPSSTRRARAAPRQLAPARVPATARRAARRARAGWRRAAARQTSATGSAGTAAGARVMPSGSRLGERERRDQPDAQAARDIGEQERHAGHVDGRHGADAVLGQIFVEQRPAAALGRQAQHGLAPQPLRERCPVAAPAPRAYPDEGLVEEVPAPRARAASPGP